MNEADYNKIIELGHTYKLMLKDYLGGKKGGKGVEASTTGAMIRFSHLKSNKKEITYLLMELTKYEGEGKKEAKKLRETIEGAIKNLESTLNLEGGLLTGM